MGAQTYKNMNQSRFLNFDPFEIMWKTLTSPSSHFNPVLLEKPSYPVDMRSTEEGLYIDLAVVGAEIDDVDITVEGDIIHVTYEKKGVTPSSLSEYFYKGIAKRDFKLSFKIASNLNPNKLVATMDKGLLVVHVPYTSKTSVESKKIKINKI